MSDIKMLIEECKEIAKANIPEVEAINDQLEKWADEAAAEYAKLRAENAEIREALKPFAEASRGTNDWPLQDSELVVIVSLVDSKHAAAVLAKFPVQS